MVHKTDTTRGHNERTPTMNQLTVILDMFDKFSELIMQALKRKEIDSEDAKRMLLGIVKSLAKDIKEVI